RCWSALWPRADAHAHKARWSIYMPADRETVTFDYGIPAELFMAKRKGGPRQPLHYRRFATAAEAIRFAVEELPAMRSLGAWMQVGDQRFDGDDIQRLYESRRASTRWSSSSTTSTSAWSATKAA